MLQGSARPFDGRGRNAAKLLLAGKRLYRNVVRRHVLNLMKFSHFDAMTVDVAHGWIRPLLLECLYCKTRKGCRKRFVRFLSGNGEVPKQVSCLHFFVQFLGKLPFSHGFMAV